MKEYTRQLAQLLAMDATAEPIDEVSEYHSVVDSQSTCNQPSQPIENLEEAFSQDFDKLAQMKLEELQSQLPSLDKSTDKDNYAELLSPFHAKHWSMP